MPGFCLPLPSKRAHATIEVDKNGVKCPNFVYRDPQNRADSSAVILGSAAKFSPHAPSSQRLIQMQHRITAASKSTGFYKKRTAENRTVLEMCRIYLFLSY